MSQVIDLRSDTVTRPTEAMRQAMARAEVGDDVFDEDPSLHQLQEQIARMLGKEAAIFLPSGTMSNQIALRLHCQPGDEFLCEASCHILNYEQAAYAQLFGLAARPIAGEQMTLQLSDVVDKIRPLNDHLVRTRLLCLENTHNRGAGRILPYETVEQLCGWASEQGLARHLDGARLFNASIATGIALSKWAEHFDTVSVCFSKGLGAPVGSALAGSSQLIRQARRIRKALGGGMRQAGVLASAASYALEHHFEQLENDHRLAKRLAEAIRELPPLELTPDAVDTNIVIFKIDHDAGTAAAWCEQLRQQGVLMNPVSSQQVRAVTHRDLSESQVEEACRCLAQIAKMPLEFERP